MATITALNFNSEFKPQLPASLQPFADYAAIELTVLNQALNSGKSAIDAFIIALEASRASYASDGFEVGGHDLAIASAKAVRETQFLKSPIVLLLLAAAGWWIFKKATKR